jgi:hypothetical protein
LHKPLGPAVFVALASATAFGVGATILSGIDAKNNPGPDAVRRECAGQGESCPAYQRGVAAQTRTNVVLGSTIGLGVATAVVGIFLTGWSSPSAPKAASTSGAHAIEPIVALGDTRLVGLQGRF